MISRVTIISLLSIVTIGAYAAPQRNDPSLNPPRRAINGPRMQVTLQFQDEVQEMATTIAELTSQLNIKFATVSPAEQQRLARSMQILEQWRAMVTEIRSFYMSSGEQANRLATALAQNMAAELPGIRDDINPRPTANFAAPDPDLAFGGPEHMPLQFSKPTQEVCERTLAAGWGISPYDRSDWPK